MQFPIVIQAFLADFWIYRFLVLSNLNSQYEHVINLIISRKIPSKYRLKTTVLCLASPLSSSVSTTAFLVKSSLIIQRGFQSARTILRASARISLLQLVWTRDEPLSLYNHSSIDFSMIAVSRASPPRLASGTWSNNELHLSKLTTPILSIHVS